MNIRTQTTITTNLYTLITKDNDRVLFSEDYYENTESNIMRTTLEALKIHYESKKHKNTSQSIEG